MRLVSILVLFCSSLPLWGMEPALCPAAVQLGYHSFIPANEKKIERLKQHRNPEVYRYANNAHAQILRSSPGEYSELGFKMSGTLAGRCIYQGPTNGKLEIFSRGSKIYLRVFPPFPEVEVFTLHEVREIKRGKIKLDYRPTTPLFVKAGNSSYHVGWAYSLSVK